MADEITKNDNAEKTELYQEILSIVKDYPKGIEENTLLRELAKRKFKIKGVIPSEKVAEVEAFGKLAKLCLLDLTMGFQKLTCADNKFFPKNEPTAKDLEIREMLSKEKPVFQSIGMGLNNGTLYFGTKLFREGQFYDAVITSDKQVFVDWKNKNEIREDFKLNYRFPLYHDVIDYMWSNTGKYGIRAWLEGGTDKVSFKEVYEEVLKLFKWKYWNPEEKIYKHHALSLISNYFLPLFEMKGRELIYGESGFGKTRLSKIYQLLSFNPSMSMDWSDSSIFRIIESAKPTIIIDNFDSVEQEKKKRILHLYNTGCYQKQKAVRSEGKSFRPTGFNIFSNMVLNSITSLDEISENRSNITRTLKTDRPEFTKLEDKLPVWSEARDRLHVLAVQSYPEVQKVYEELKEDKIVSRELERVSPNLTIAKLIDKGLYDEMIGFYVKDNERRKVRDFKDDWVYLAVEKIAEKLQEQDEVELKVKDIAEEIASELWNRDSKDFERKKHGLSVVVGSAFKNCILFPVRTLQGYSVYTFTKESIVKFCRLKDYGNDIIENIKQKSLTNSPNSTHSLNSPHSPHSPKSKTGDSGEIGESVGHKPTNNLDEDKESE